MKYMRKVTAMAVLLAAMTIFAPQATAMNHIWSKGFGGLNPSTPTARPEYGRSVTTDPSGNVLVTGYFWGTADFGGGNLTSAGGYDIFLAKYAADGTHLWSQRFGGTAFDWGYSVATDSSGNVLVTGYFAGTVNFGGGDLTSAGIDIFLAKYAADGTHLWSQRFGGTGGEYGWSVTSDPSGNVLVTGYFSGTANFGGGDMTSAGLYDIFLAKYAADGTHLWSKRFGGTSNDYVCSVETDPSGNVLVTGNFWDTANFGGGDLTSAGAYDIFLAKYAADGTHLWSQRFGGIGSDSGYSVETDPSGNVLVTGSFTDTVDFGGGVLTSAGGYDIFLAKYAADGTHLRSQRFGGTGYDYGYSVETDPSGNVLVTGYFSNTVDFGGGDLTSAGGADIFLAKYAADGTHLWSQRFGGTGNDYGYGVTSDPSGNVLVTGGFRNTVDFGGGNLTGTGYNDIFLFKYGVPAPAVTAVSSATADGSYKAGGTVSVTVTFSEAVNVAGGPPRLTLNTGGVANYSSGSGGTVLTFTYTVAAGHNSSDLDYISTAALALNGGTVKDTATGTKDAILTLPAPGAAGSLGANKAIVIDTAAPTLAEDTAVSTPTNDNTPDYIFSSTEAGAITYSGDCSSVTTAAVSGNNTVIFGTLADGAHGNCKISVTDSAGNVSAELAVSPFTVDTVAPTVTVSQAAAQTDPATGSPINFTVVFSEPVTGFATGDVTLTGIAGATTGTVTETAPNDGTTYNVAVSGMTSMGTVIAGIGSGVATDAAGNGNAASADDTVTYTPPPPSVSSINRVGTSPTNAASVDFTVTFSESVSGIDTSDFSLALTGTADGSVASVSAASGTGITVTVNTVTGDGTLGLNLTDNDSIVNGMSVPLGGTGAGNGNFTGQTYAIDKTGPTVTISQAAAQADPASASPINFTVVFSEPVTGFATGDVTITGTAGATTGTVTGSGTTYNVAVSGMTSMGTVIAGIGSGVATDAAGNGNAASTSADDTVTYTPPPASVMSVNRAGTSPTNAASVDFTVNFSENMSGIDISDFSLALTGTADGTIASVSASSGTSITVTVNTVTGDGTLGLNVTDNDSIVNGMSVPLGGTGAGNGSFTGEIYTVDRVSPAVTLSSAASEPTGSSPFTVTAAFSENVTGFAPGDIGVTNGSAGNFTAVSGTVYTFDVTPAADGTVTVNIPAGAAQDSLGNNNSASTALSRTYDHTLVPGYGSSPASGSSISVGTANVGSAVSTALQVSETGNAVLNITSHVLSGADASDFSVTPATLSIADGGPARNLTIQCVPGDAGLRTATLTVNHNAAGSPATYTLNCTGTSPVTAGVSIISVTNVKATTALAEGYSGASGATERGFFWWNDEQYWGDNASGLIPAGGSGAGNFSLTLTGLPMNTQLYVAAYVRIGGQVITSGPGNFISITTTDPLLPAVITKPDFTVNGTGVLAKGEITDVGSSAVTIYGFVYAAHTAPTVWDMALPFTWDMTLPISVGKPFEGTIKNLAPGTYYFRAYAHNSQGTAYGEEFSFTITGGGDCTGGVPGDLNGDGNVDLGDAIIALKILDGVAVGNLSLKGDVNGDCKIGLEEAIFVLQKVGVLR